MAEITLSFKPNGEVEVQNEPGQDAEKQLKWLLTGLGKIERRGHKHGAHVEEGVRVTR